MRGVWRGSKLLILSVAIIIIAVVFGFGAFAIATPALDGEDVVKLMYEFQDVRDLDSNKEKLRDLVTDSVFDEITVDTEGRRLNTYLRFMASPTRVSIIKKTNDYVLYHIKNENIDSKRVFLFMFEITNGKVSKVREAEIIDFVEVND